MILRSLAMTAAFILPITGNLLAADWLEITPGGTTKCARGDDFSFFVYEGNPDKVVIDFLGGGACWDVETCAPGSPTFIDSIDNIRDRAERGELYGVYNKEDERNPYAGWTHVVIPYCTGDVHWGEQDQTYTRKSGESFTIYHRGATNVSAALAWVDEHLNEATKLHVTGCSAGSYGSIYWTPKIAEMFPEAQLSQFGDAGAGIVSESFRDSGFSNWAVERNAPTWIPELDPESVDWHELEISDMYTHIANYYPSFGFHQHNSNGDVIQQFFLSRMGGNPRQWTDRMYDSMQSIYDRTDNFNYYIAPYDSHCAITEPEFYTTVSNGVLLRDWLGQVMDFESVDNVTCGDDC